MVDYRNILDYISYFENITKQDYTECRLNNTEEMARTFSNPVFDDKFDKFIDELYESDLLSCAYMRNLNKYQVNFDRILDIIESSDFELLKSILTYYVRQERFCDGVWAKAIKEGIFLKILYRLQQITII